MLDKLPAPVRHAVIALASALLAWAATSIHSLHVSPELGVILGTIITIATTALTPLTKQYGVGKDSSEGVDDYWND